MQEPSCQEMHWGMGHWAQTALPGLSTVPGLAQSFSLRFSSFSLPGYIYIFRTLCPASSKWCKISPLLCDFHSLVQRLEEHIGAIPYLRAQPPSLPPAPPLIYFHWLHFTGYLAAGRISSLFIQLNGSCHDGLKTCCYLEEEWQSISHHPPF